MEKETQNNNISYSSDWDDYTYSPTITIESPTLPIFTDSLDKNLNVKLLNKRPGKIIYNNMNKSVCNENECLICYEKVEKNHSKVICKLCSNIFHYECYKKFIEKNKNYNLKCCHCSTKTLKFKMKYWWNCCF